MGRNHSIVHVHDILQMCPLYVIHSLVIYAQEHKLGIHSTKGAVAVRCPGQKHFSCVTLGKEDKSD